MNRKITIECSIGNRPDQNSILYTATVGSLKLKEALEVAFKKAKEVNHLKEYKGFRLVSIEEF